MARVRAVLAALATAARRDFRTVAWFSGNNLFVAAISLLAMNDPGAFVAMSAFIGLVLFIPLSASPLRLAPRDRLAVWPLRGRERRALEVLALGLSPVAWLIVGLAVWKRASAGLVAMTAGVFAAGFVPPSTPPARRGVWRRMPAFPGPLNQLIRKNLRETLSTLDFWGSAAVGAFPIGLRIAGALTPDALLPSTILVMLAISTYAQALFGLDGEGGMTRYRLLPVPGWQILAAKDVAFVLLSVMLTLPLAPAAGLAAAHGAGGRAAGIGKPPQRPGALALFERGWIRCEFVSGRRDVRGRCGGALDAGAAGGLRGCVCGGDAVGREGVGSV
jgi:hypothetical protein